MTKTIGGKAKRLKRQARLRRQGLLKAFYGRMYAGDTPIQAYQWCWAQRDTDANFRRWLRPRSVVDSCIHGRLRPGRLCAKCQVVGGRPA